MRLPVRFYRGYPMDVTAPHPAEGHLGPAEKNLDLDPAGLIVTGMHLWNIGEPGGPDVTPDGPDWSITRLYDYYADAQQVIQDNIRPIFDAARTAGVQVVHIATRRYAHHYPQYAQTLSNYGDGASDEPPGCVDTSWEDEYYRDRLGMGVSEAKQEVDRVKNKIRVAQCVAPQPEDEVVLNGGQLNNLLRERKANTIIYTGFAANFCLQESPGGLVDMRDRGYRLIVVRDATAALEDIQSAAERANLNTAIAHIERDFGYSCTTEGLVSALGTLKTE